MNNYTVYHLHTDMSNAFTTMDSVTNYKEYIKKAKELDMKALAFSEHGSVLSWINKKMACEENGIKYIHATEAYITKSLDEKIRDNMHCILIAKNLEGVKEINKLSSASFNKKDNHMYYNPRISYEELKNTSDNIIITTACLGGILNSNNDELENDFIDFMQKNKHRCFLEIQHHNVDEQIEYNKKMYSISKEKDIPLIAGSDTHALNEKHMMGRKLLQKRKNIHFESEDGWDLSFKTYNEFMDCFKEQNSLPKDVYIQAIENTNRMADMVEEFGLDFSNKYPSMYENSEEVFRNKIKEGIKWREIDKKDNYDEYLKRIDYEIETFKHNGAVDFMLLEEKIKTEMRNRDIHAGYSRGSVSGSLVAYILGITEVDSIKYNMNFERFMNKERVSLADIDSDWSLKDRPKVKEYIYSIENTYSAEIITFNTIALKGAIRDCGGGLDMELSIVDKIAKNIEADEEKYRKEFSELFEYVDLLQGTIVSIGIHPSATIVSPEPLDEVLGTFNSNTCDYPISQVNMKEVDKLNFVKLDVLGLDNIGIINDTCEMVGIERLTPDNMDFEDDKVWENILLSPIGIFQFESSFAWSYLCQILSKYSEIREKTSKVTRVDLMSIGNGAIRPAGSSYRESLGQGIINDTGNNIINELMSNTLSYLVYQEQLLDFLHKFCGYSMGQADIVRRGFAKKTGTDKFIPIIKDGFIKVMTEEYGYTIEKAENDVEAFLTVIIDASSYLFSKNHSDPYTFIGFATAYLRTYYPLEFISTALDYNEDNLEKTSKFIEYAKEFPKIKINSIKFRYSSGRYQPNKETNSIYKGIGSIKGINEEIGNQLYEIRDNEFDSFTMLLSYLKENVKINQRQLQTLIKLDFFTEFGKSKKLSYIADLYYAWQNKKTAKFYNKTKDEPIQLPFREEILERHSQKKSNCQYSGIDFVGVIKEIESLLEDEDYSMKEKIEFQLEYLGYVNISNPDLDKRYILVTNLDTKYSPRFDGYCLNNGKAQTLKIRRKPKRKQPNNTYFDDRPFKEGDIIYVNEFERKMGVKKVEDEWVNTGEYNWWCKNYRLIKEGEI